MTVYLTSCQLVNIQPSCLLEVFSSSSSFFFQLVWQNSIWSTFFFKCQKIFEQTHFFLLMHNLKNIYTKCPNREQNPNITQLSCELVAYKSFSCLCASWVEILLTGWVKVNFDWKFIKEKKKKHRAQIFF